MVKGAVAMCGRGDARAVRKSGPQSRSSDRKQRGEAPGRRARVRKGAVTIDDGAGCKSRSNGAADGTGAGRVTADVRSSRAEQVSSFSPFLIHPARRRR
jgi:hypothetical protein